MFSETGDPSTPRWRLAGQLCGMFPTTEVFSTLQNTGNSLGLGGE